MSNLWYILNKSEHQQRLQQQLQLQLRQQLELPPAGMSSDRFQYPQQATTPQASPTAAGPRDIIPFGQQYPPHPEQMQYDPNAPPPGGPHMLQGGDGHNNIEWKYHTHRPEADGDSLGRKAGKRKLVIPRDLLKMKQMNAALKIGVPPSTFSKRWRESLPDRTWPYRNHRRIEKNIKMLKAMQNKGHDVTEELGRMQQQQEENLSPAVIDVYEDVNEEYLMKVDEKKWPAAAGGPRQVLPAGIHHQPYPPPNIAQIQAAQQQQALQIPTPQQQQQMAQLQSQLAAGQAKIVPHPMVPVAQPQLQAPPAQVIQTNPTQLISVPVAIPPHPVSSDAKQPVLLQPVTTALTSPPSTSSSSTAASSTSENHLEASAASSIPIQTPAHPIQEQQSNSSTSISQPTTLEQSASVVSPPSSQLTSTPTSSSSPPNHSSPQAPLVQQDQQQQNFQVPLSTTTPT